MQVTARENYLNSFLLAFNDDVGAMTILNKTWNKIAEEIFKKKNEEMKGVLPDLLHVSNSISEKRTFKHLTDHLHEIAEQLDCNQMAPSDLTSVQRITWEFIHVKELLIKVKKKQAELIETFNEIKEDLKKLEGIDTQRVKDIIEAGEKFLLEREKYLKLLEEEKQKDRGATFLKGINILVHPENGHVDTIIKTLPGFLANTYKEAKQKGMVEVFFYCFNTDQPCLEAAWRSLEDFMMDLAYN